LKATLERASGSRVVLDIEVPPEELAPEIEQARRRLARQVRIPGFRPGKAPATLVERAVGRPRILQEALAPAVEKAYREAIAQQGLSPVDQPEIEVKEFEDGQGLRFVARVDVRPEVRLPDYRAVRVPVEVPPVTEEDVERALGELRERHATWVPVEGPAADGHLVILRTTGQVEGGPRVHEPRVEGILGAGQLRPAIEEAVRGLTPGSAKELDLEFGEDDPARALRGKRAHLRVELLEVKARELPALDDAFAAEVSDKGTLEELRAELGNRLRQAARNQAVQAALDKALAAVVDGAEVEVPESLVRRTVDNLLADLELQLRARGTSLAAHLSAQGKTEAQLREEVRPAAERRVKSQLVLEAVARDAGLWPDEAAVEAEIARQVAASRADPEELRRAAARPEVRAAVAAELARSRALGLLRETALVEGEAGQAAPQAPTPPEGPAAADASADAQGQGKGSSA
jgi:trigger factor